MKKYKNGIILVAVLVVVFLGAFLVSKYGAPKPFKEISYDQYLEIRQESDENFVYASSSDENVAALSSFAKDADIVIYYLNTSDLTEEQLKEVYGDNEGDSLLTAWSDNEEKYSYTGEMSGYKITKDFMNNDLIDTDIITINADEYVNIIKEDEFSLMFIGSATCGYCTQFKPELQSILDEHDVNIYYIDLSEASNEDLQKLYATDSYFSTEQWGTPLTFLYKNGERIDVINGYVEAATVLEVLQNNKVI